MYKHLEHIMCKELQALEEKYRNDAEMSEGDLRRVDLLVHSLKSLATYSAMKEAEEARGYENYNNQSYMNNGGNSYMGNSYMNNSYARGRDSMGRYTSRDMAPDMSGHYPMYPEDRRW